MDITALKDFIDLGGIFIFAMVLLYMVSKKLDKIETNTDKMLVIMMILAKGLYGGNPIKDVLKKDADELKVMLNNVK